jgi:O-antigen/teichoic acid export membrane protein
VVRLLSKEQYGTYAVILSLFAISVSVLDGGFFDGARKFIAEQRSIPRWKDHVFAFYVRIGLFVTISFSIVLLFLMQIGFFNTFSSEVNSFIPFVILMLVARQSFLIVRGSLLGLELELFSEPLRTARKFLLLLVGAGLIVLGMGTEGLFIGHVVSEGIALIVGTYLLSTKIDLKTILARAPDQFPRSELIKFNFNSVIMSILLVSTLHIDVLLIQYFLTSEQTGVYKSAVVILSFLNVLPMTIGSILVSASSSLWDQNQMDEVNNLLSQLVQVVSLASILFGVGLLVLSDEVVGIYLGPGYGAASLVLTILVPGGIMLAVAQTIISSNQGVGELTNVIIPAAISTLVNIVLNVVLIPRFNIRGAAVATTISYGVLLGFLTMYSRRSGLVPFKGTPISKVILTCLLFVGVLKPIEILLPELWSLVLVPPIGFGLFIAILYVLDILPENSISTAYQKILGLLNTTPHPDSD